ncbi:RNA-processing protein [Candidatus Woesearchaeota archaeon]|nr:RNA-processing protein [Candidatus Woesearchaeota archaeon]
MPRKKKQEEMIEPGDEPEAEYNDNYSAIGSGGSDYSYTIRIPRDRIAALIGVKGKDKKELEECSKAKINVDSQEGDVTISGRDAVSLYTLREVILAIARGFSPETARLLLKADYMLEIINLKDYGLDNKNKLARVKSRVIGTGGKARRVIEELTGASLSVYGKTISIIGECSQVPYAKRAIELLIKGSMHATVFKWLENQKRKERRERQEAW